MPARYVGPYAEADAVNTLALFEKLNPILDREKTRDAYRLDVDLLPMVLEMRRRGIRIDQDAAEQARDLLLAKRDAALAELSAQLGTPSAWPRSTAANGRRRPSTHIRIAYPRTAKGNPSFAAGKSGWMAKHEHWLPQLIATANKYDAAGTKFLEGHILNHIVNGRIHAEIHPFRADDGGTRSSRFSYSNPPLQQMPSRDPRTRAADPQRVPAGRRRVLGQARRQRSRNFASSCTTPCSTNCAGAQEAADVYRNNPDADFHTMVAEMTGLDRSAAKAINFAKIYGAGVQKLAEMIGKPLAETQAIVTPIRRASCRSWRSSLPSARRRRRASATPCSMTARAGTGICGKCRGSTPRVPARADRRSAAPHRRPRASLVRPAAEPRQHLHGA